MGATLFVAQRFPLHPDIARRDGGAPTKLQAGG
jgi:hypothetical protein